MPVSGLSLNPKCVEVFNELKNRQHKYVIYKISDDAKEIVVDETGTEPDYEVFREKLLSKKEKTGKDRPSYAVYDLEYELGEGEGKRNKVTFLTFINQDSTSIKSRMVYASSREVLKNALTGIGMDRQANDADELEFAGLVKEASKGKAV